MTDEIRGDFHGILFIFVGRLVGDKGVNELVNAFHKICKEYDDIRLYLIGGEEEDLDPLKNETLKEIDNNPKIYACGRQKDIRPYLGASDVLILPSYREGFPNVVLEALAMGLPCIVSDVNGATDAIQDGINGFIIPKRDADAVYVAIRQLIIDCKLRQSMASVAREIVTKKFTNKAVWKATLSMYNNL